MFQKMDRKTEPPPAGTAQPAGAGALMLVDTIDFADGAQLTLPTSHRVDGADGGEDGGADGADERGHRLDGQPIRLEGGSDLFNHRAYTLLIDFRRERESDSGGLISFDGSFSLTAGVASLAATVVTSLGERELSAGGLSLGVGEWHRAALTFSGWTGRAALYLDGRELARVTDLQGAEQAGNFFAELLIGASRGRSFSGLIDRFKFIDQALERDELPAL